jgi:hypothetical protein
VTERGADGTGIEPVDLAALPDPELRAYLVASSGLPGPRADLGLADAAAAQLPADVLRRLAAAEDEYLALCGATGLGRMLAQGADAGLVVRLEELSRDPRWRVREGVVRGLQAAAVRNADAVLALTAGWVASGDLRLARAAVATLCEPPLLKSESIQRAAIDACERATRTLLTADRGRSDDARSLATALAYTWSVAVAANPALGLPAFTGLAANPSPVAQRIVMQNLGKARLRRLGIGPAQQ